MRKITTYIIALLVLTTAACSDDPGLFGTEKAYAIGQAGSRVLEVSGTRLLFEHDFVFYDENGVLDASKFALEERTFTFGGSGKLEVKLKSLELVNAEPRGCYSIAVLSEQNAMERPERPEQLARYIFKNTPACSNYALAVYPERDATLFPVTPYKIIGTSFVNEGAKFDQDLGSIAYNNHQLFEQSKEPFESQLKGLDAVTKFVADNATGDNKQVFMMYQAFSGDDSDLSKQIRDYAVANNIAINAVKNDFSSDDVILRLSQATGGIYFMPDDYDPFHAVAKSDYYAIALHADKFMSGNYSFYRATYELTTNTDYFYSGMDFWVSMRALLDEKSDDDNLVKLMPCYVPIP